MSQVAVLGSGSWGTTLSLLLKNNGHGVRLWAWDPDEAQAIISTRQSPRLPGFHVPESILVTTSMPHALEGADVVLFVTISSAAPDVCTTLRPLLRPGVPVICATKGLHNETRLTMSQTLQRALGMGNPIVVLSGPNLALEIARGFPSASVAACSDEEVAKVAQRLLMNPLFRVYTGTDVLGVELAGALKNVIAIGAGISDGLGFGDNAKAALLTRGLAEITRLGVKLGARQVTFMGLSGIGDLMATCASPLSRNHRVGLGLGAGRKLDVILHELGHVAEGIPTTQAAHSLALENDVPMPITEEVYRVLFEGKSPTRAVSALMTREPKDEVQ